MIVSTNTQAKVIEIISEMGVEKSSITLDSDLQKDLALDSLDLAELVFQIEIAFKIKVPDTATEGMVTVEDVVVYLDGIV